MRPCTLAATLSAISSSAVESIWMLNPERFTVSPSLIEPAAMVSGMGTTVEKFE